MNPYFKTSVIFWLILSLASLTYAAWQMATVGMQEWPLLMVSLCALSLFGFRLYMYKRFKKRGGVDKQ